MTIVLRRVCAVIVLVAGAALGFWIVFGSPHAWEGAQRLGRLALGLTSMCLISASAWLMFPGSPEDDEEAGHDPAPAPGPLDV
ncbi:hypothetical protein ACIRD2_23400 [Streptomyces sp. NPDC093595]|uniref:hypothetical protein n=1 Tax=Streptomyces sp. NPDC093595 TaxID=3366045 RepID=UPI0038104974